MISRLDRIMQEHISKKQTELVIFKGFPSYCYDHLNTHYTSLSTQEFKKSNGYIDIERLTKQSNEVVSKFFQIRETTWAFYEEFILLCETINNIKNVFSGQIVIIDNNLYSGYYPLDIGNSGELMGILESDSTNEDEMNPLSKFYSDCIKINDTTFGFTYINKHTDEGIKELPFIDSIDFIENSSELQEYETVHIKDKGFYDFKEKIINEDFRNDIIIKIDNIRERKALLPFITLLNAIGIKFIISLTNKFEDLDKSESDKYINILEKHWHTRKFRDILFYANPDLSAETIQISQGNIISDILNQCHNALLNQEDFSDIFVTAPTGAGKSLLFQIPAIELMENYNAVTLVITPLKALMLDQVDQLTNERNVKGVTYINSDISPQEKENRVNQIKEGAISIIYLSPELFLANSLESLIGNRKIGLLVVDEAHLVTTWGRDFRADYWYLGDYVEKMRKTTRFPILCLTATAVYMGTEDMVNDTIISMNMYKPKVYLGNVRRENIGFDIRNVKRSEISGGFEEYKVKKTKERIESFINKNKKVICYCPYATQVEDIYNSIDVKYRKKVGKYYGSYDKYAKGEAQEKFKNGEYNVMICTKAFGMGIDIADIEIVYHFAPTGNLADYVQEIGRAARNPDINGIAMSDFTSSDLKYVRMLNGLSGIKQYQLKQMMHKLYVLYNEKKSRNMLISPEIFSYLFNEKDIENKVKNGLLLLSKDLEQKYSFKVMTVRPKSMFTKNFVCVPMEIEEEFKKNYGEFIKPIYNDKPRVIPSNSFYSGDITITNGGQIYEVHMSDLWEKNFSHYTFAQFKREFFQGDLFHFDSDAKLTARLSLTIRFTDDFEAIKEKLEENINNLIKVFGSLNKKGNFFTKSDFRETYKYFFKNELKSQEIPSILLDLFVADISENIGFNYNANKLKFVQQRKSQDKDELAYRVMNSNYMRIKGSIMRVFMQCKNTSSDNVYSTFIPIHRSNNRPPLMYLAILLELFNLGSYEVMGGKNMEIFIRLNDPLKLKRLSNKNYSNSILTEIERKRKKSQEILKGFMQTELSDNERWDLIENYFLGNEEMVNMILQGGLAEESM